MTFSGAFPLFMNDHFASHKHYAKPNLQQNGISNQPAVLKGEINVEDNSYSLRQRLNEQPPLLDEFSEGGHCCMFSG